MDVMLGLVRRGALAAATAFAMTLPGAARADTWRGQLLCGIIPTLTTKSLVSPLEMRVEGARASYSHRIQSADSGRETTTLETGQGRLDGDAITLQGGSHGAGWSFTATYQGRIEGRGASLTGEQVWTAPTLPQPFHRACRITISH